MKERLFIAIPVKIKGFEALKNLFDPLVSGKYSREEQLHLTVVFLGDVLGEKEIIDRLSTIDLGFEVSSIEGLGYFNQSRVLVGLCQNDSIKALRRRIFKALELGSGDDDYRLHVTLMRVKKVLDSEQFEKMINKSENQIGVLERRLILYRSHLDPDGARYIPLKEFIL